MEELKERGGGPWALERAGGADDRQQAGRQQEARVEGQPRDNEGTLLEATATNEGLMKRFDITREEKRRQERREVALLHLERSQL